MRETAVVLGCSSGVGAAIAKALAPRNIIGFHRGNHSFGAMETHHAILAANGAARFYCKDVGSTYTAVQDGLAIVQKQLLTQKSLDVFVHSLSGASIGKALTRPVEQVEKTFNCLAHSFLWWIQGLVNRDLLAPNAQFIALSNPCPDFYLQESGVIGAAKAALESYVRILAAELGPKGYRVNCIRFSTVLTPALEKVLPPNAVERLHELHKHIVPLGRMQEAEDVANFAKLLVDEKCNWVNGSVLDLTGGAPMMLMSYAFHPPR